MTSPNGSRLVVGTRAFWQAEAFVVLGTRLAAISLSGPAAAVVGQPVSIQATLSLDGVPASARTPLTLDRSGRSGFALLGTVLVGAGGAATIVDTPPYPGATTWTAHWGGGQSHALADARVTEQLDKAPTSLRIAFVASKQRGKRLPGTIVVSLDPTLHNRIVTVTATTSAGTVQLFSETVPTTGQLSVPYTVIQTPTLTASSTGAAHQDTTASTTVSLRA